MRRTLKEFERNGILFNESYVVFLEYKTVARRRRAGTSEQSRVNQNGSRRNLRRRGS
jgi:hypothetical protein